MDKQKNGEIIIFQIERQTIILDRTKRRTEGKTDRLHFHNIDMK